MIEMWFNVGCWKLNSEVKRDYIEVAEWLRILFDTVEISDEEIDYDSKGEIKYHS